MFGLLGKLFGTEKAIEGIVDATVEGLDKLYYSDEEKAEDAAKARSEARAMIIQWMMATQGQNLARRLIALTITAVWLGMYLVSVLARMIAVFTDSHGAVTAAKVDEVGDIALKSAQDMNGAVMLILAFYFAAPHMGDIASAAIGKMRTRMG